MESKSKKSKKTTKSIGIITEPKSVKSSVVSSSIIKIASVRSAHVGKGSARSEIVATNMVSPNTTQVAEPDHGYAPLKVAPTHPGGYVAIKAPKTPPTSPAIESPSVDTDMTVTNEAGLKKRRKRRNTIIILCLIASVMLCGMVALITYQLSGENELPPGNKTTTSRRPKLAIII